MCSGMEHDGLSEQELIFLLELRNIKDYKIYWNRCDI